MNPAGTQSCSAPLLHFDGGPVTDVDGELNIVNDCESDAVHPFAAVTVTE